MTGPLFFDTNVLAYAMDPADPFKQKESRAILLQALLVLRLVVSPQILNECYGFLVLKWKIAASSAASFYLSGYHACCTAPLDLQTHRAAVALTTRHRLSWWDCVAVTSALQAN